MKTLVAIFDLYILLMGFLSLLVTAPLMWNAAPNAYFGVLMVLCVWVTIIATIAASIAGAHEAGKTREKHDL